MSSLQGGSVPERWSTVPSNTPRPLLSISYLGYYIWRKLVICTEQVSWGIRWAGYVARKGWGEGSRTAFWPGNTLNITIWNPRNRWEDYAKIYCKRDTTSDGLGHSGFEQSDAATQGLANERETNLSRNEKSFPFILLPILYILSHILVGVVALMTVYTNSVVFCVVMSCSSETAPRFGATYHLHHQGRRVNLQLLLIYCFAYFSVSKMGAIFSSETLGSLRIARHYDSQDRVSCLTI